jgi:ubiquinone/menaquinone biosynthesis C-methylase UbiE
MSNLYQRYVNHSQFHHQYLQSALETLHLNYTDAVVLDLACGDGRLTAAIAQSIP